MANTSKTSGISLSRSMFQLLCTLSNGWYPLYISWDLLEVGRFPWISRHFRCSSSFSLALSPGPADPGAAKPGTALGVGWSAWGCPAHTCRRPTPPHPTIWSSWRLPRRRTLPKLSLNLVTTFHPLAIWTALLSVQNHPLNLCWSIHKVFWNACSHMVYAFPLAICTIFAACLRING